MLDLGLNKAVVAARRIAELDPYLSLEVVTSEVTAELVDGFLDGLDVLIDQADSLDIKVLLREVARDRGIPVLMATSDRGLLDVERFDLQPQPSVMHGLLGDMDTTALGGLSTRDKLPYLLRLLDARHLSARGAASLVEVGQTLGGWPQLAADIWVVRQPWPRRCAGSDWASRCGPDGFRSTSRMLSTASSRPPRRMPSRPG